MFQLLTRLLWPFLPYVLALASGVLGLVGVSMMLGEHPEQPTDTPIATLIAGGETSKWCTFSDGVMDWPNVGVFEETRDGVVTSETFYVPYSSETQAAAWSLGQPGSANDTVLLVEYSKEQMKEAFPKEARGRFDELYTVHAVTGVLNDNMFELDDEVEDAYKRSGFDEVVVMEVGKEPASLGSEIQMVVMMFAITALCVWWIRARLSDGSWHGLNF